MWTVYSGPIQVSSEDVQPEETNGAGDGGKDK